MSSPISERIYARARKVLPGGISRNTIFRLPQPFYAAAGSGCYVTDVEGVRRIDFSNNVASLIHGHAHPLLLQTINEQLQKGTAFGIGTEAEVLFAEHLCQRVPGFDKIRFVNSGSEAIMATLKLARAFTGRPKIAKAEGAYHGGYDYAEVSQGAKPSDWGSLDAPNKTPLSHGTPQGVLDDVVVIPYNDPARAVKLLDAHADQIACVLIDLLPHRVGFVPANPEFVRVLREWTRRNQALLIFDEVITLRCHYAGLQSAYAERPDLTAMGKMIGGGFPVGALAGREEVMQLLDPTNQATFRMPHSGTFSANAITMAAGRAAMELFDRDAVNRLNQLTNMARERISDAIRSTGIPACVTGAGSIFRVHLKPTPPTDYRTAYSDARESKALGSLIDYLFDHGIIVINSCSGTLSTPMTEKEIEHLAEAMLGGFRHIQPLLS